MTDTPEAAPTPSADIVGTAVAAGAFTTLAAPLTAAGLVETLNGPDPCTVFAPTDEAFAKLPARTDEELLKDPTGQLAQILTYHVVLGEVMAATAGDTGRPEGEDGPRYRAHRGRSRATR